MKIFLFLILVLLSCKSVEDKSNLIENLRKEYFVSSYRFNHTKIHKRETIKIRGEYVMPVHVVDSEKGLFLRREANTKKPPIILIPDDSIVRVLYEDKEEVISDRIGKWLLVIWENPNNYKTYKGYLFSGYIVDGYTNENSFSNEGSFKVLKRSVSPSQKYYLEIATRRNNPISICSDHYSASFCNAFLFSREDKLIEDLEASLVEWDSEKDYFIFEANLYDAGENNDNKSVWDPINKKRIWSKAEYTNANTITSSHKQVCRFEDCFFFKWKKGLVKIYYFVGGYDYKFIKKEPIFQFNANQIRLTDNREDLTFYLDENCFQVNVTNQVISCGK